MVCLPFFLIELTMLSTYTDQDHRQKYALGDGNDSENYIFYYTNIMKGTKALKEMRQGSLIEGGWGGGK